MRNHLWLFILVMLTLALIGGYLGHVWPVAGTAPAAPSKAQPDNKGLLLAFDKTKAVGLDIRRGQEPLISVRRRANEGWLLDVPFSAPIDAQVVERLLLVLNHVTVSDAVPQVGSQLAEFGLGDNPSVTKIVVRTEEGERWLELGHASTNGTMRYARSSTRRDIALVEPKALKEIPRDANALFDRRIFPLALEPLRAIEVKQGNRSVILQAEQDGWVVASLAHARADVDGMNDWLRRLALVAADAVYAAETREASPRDWIGSLGMTAGRVTVTTDFYRAGDRIIAERSDQPRLRFATPAAVLPSIFPDLFSLRDKRLITAESGAIAHIELRHRDRSVRFRRTATGWTMGSRSATDSPAETVENWVVELRLARGVQFIPERCNVRTAPHWSVTLHGYNGQVLGQVHLARTPDCGDVATLPSGEWVRLPSTLLIDQMPARI